MSNRKKLNLINILICIFVSILCVFNYNYFTMLKYQKYKLEQKNNNLTKNKVIIIGDSRMWLIELKKEEYSIPNSVIFISKSGARIDWLKEEAVYKLKEILKTNNNYNYHVIFNLGVNDLNEDINPQNKAKEYYNYYKSIIDTNKEVSFYFLSVNPIDENRIYKYFSMYNKRTNDKIKKFNNYFINRLNIDRVDNASYCNSYEELNFYLPDGLHYDTNTDKKIIKYILEQCINY